MITDKTIFKLWDSKNENDVLIGIELALKNRESKWFKMRSSKNVHWVRDDGSYYYTHNLRGHKEQAIESEKLDILVGYVRLFFTIK